MSVSASVQSNAGVLVRRSVQQVDQCAFVVRLLKIKIEPKRIGRFFAENLKVLDGCGAVMAGFAQTK